MYSPKNKEVMRPIKPIKDNQGSKSRLNKFVRRLHDMLVAEKDSGIVEWRRGLLVLHRTDEFALKLLPKYFGTSNFKTFR
jgi:HSF-type DNA-binding